MIINRIESEHISNDIAWEINGWLAGSRFYADVEMFRSSVKITNVRLREKKLYCGNHPKACERAVHGKHKRLDYLEGADWVEFNDGINDILDRMGVECSFRSNIVICRKGRCRRVYYSADHIQQADGNWQWDKDGPGSQYADFCGLATAPRSGFPFGTPGIHAQQDYFCVGAHDH